MNSGGKRKANRGKNRDSVVALDAGRYTAAHEDVRPPTCGLDTGSVMTARHPLSKAGAGFGSTARVDVRPPKKESNRNREGERPREPGAWQVVQMVDICDRRIDMVDPRRTPDHSFRYVDITSVDNALKRIVTPRMIIGREAPSRARQRIKVGDVLVATTRPNLNAVAQVPVELDGQIASTGFCVLRPREGVDGDYLFAFVQSAGFVERLSDLVKGALYPAVSDNQVFAQDLPLPTLIDQRRIAAHLKAQLAEVDRARSALQAQLEAAKGLPAASLRAVFGDAARVDARPPTMESNRNREGERPREPRTQRAEWRRVTLGDILTLRKDVVHPRNKPCGRATFVGLEHVESGTGTRLGAIEFEMANLTGRKPRFFAGDIVYGYLRPYLNKVWLADSNGLCSVDQYVFMVAARQADAGFVAWFMRSSQYLERAPVGITPGQLPRIRTQEVAQVPLSLPPLPVQRALAARLQAEIAAATEIRTALEAKLATLDRLPAALLRQVFGDREQAKGST